MTGPVKCLVSVFLAAFVGGHARAQSTPTISPHFNHCQDDPPPPGCRPPPPPPPPHHVSTHSLSGSTQPKYQILTVVYAPPGTTGGQSKTSTEYTSSSVTGSKIENSDNFKSDLSVSATVGADVIGSGVSIGGGLSISTDSGSTNALDLKVTTEVGITSPATGDDGINHDLDKIWLLLNPSVPLIKTWKEDQTGNDPPVIEDTLYQWSMALTTGGSNLYSVSVGDLKNMPPTTAAQLQAYGIGPQDYATILSADPLATGASIVDNPRYVTIGQVLPYKPGADVTSYTLKSDQAYTAGTNATVDTALSISVEAKGSFIASADFKVEGKWTYTHKSSFERSSGYSSEAVLKMGGPSNGFVGITQVEIFWDTIFHTFAFNLYRPSGPALVDGVIHDAQNKVVPYTPVSIAIGGLTRLTYTDQGGHYSFYQLPPGQTGVIAVQGVSRQVAIGPSVSADIVLTPAH